jgi:hypothetical protein
LISLKENKATRSESKVIDSPLVESFSKHLENAVKERGSPSRSGDGNQALMAMERGTNSSSIDKERDSFKEEVIERREPSGDERRSSNSAKERDSSKSPMDGVLKPSTRSSADSKSSNPAIQTTKSTASPKSEKSYNSNQPSVADTASSVEKRIFNMSTQLVDELFDEAPKLKRPFPKSPTSSSNTFKIPPPGRKDDGGLAYVDPEEANAKRELFENVGSSKKVKTGDEGKRFMISGVSGSGRSVLCGVIRKLGGEVLEGEGWDQTASHLICAKPSKTEKCLAACASGAWMLSPTYLEESEKENRFLAESGFEWSAARDFAAMAVGKDRECIEAGSRWRIKLGNYMRGGKQRGSFQNWCVLLVVEEKKKKGFVSVLEAGLATVYTDKADASGDVEVC